MGLLVSDNYWVDTVVLVLTLLYLIYWYGTSTFDYWAKRGVRELKTKEPFFGAVRKSLFLQQQLSLHYHEMYKELEGEKYGGFFNMRTPAVMVRDPDLLKYILIKDFSSFTDNTSHVNGDNDPMFAYNIFGMKGDQWKYARSKVAPAFTSGKIKTMFPLILEVCNELKQHMQRRIDSKDGSFEAHNLSAEFTTDVVASCAFGIKADTLRQPDNQFRKMGIDLFDPGSFLRQLEVMLVIFVPKVASLLRLKFINKRTEEFFKDLIFKAFAFREKHAEFKRNDFINLLMQLRKIGSVDVDENDKKEISASNDTTGAEKGKFDFNDLFLTAQAVGFFADGFETSSRALAFVLHELAMNPDIQEKLRDELREKFPEEIDYDNIRSCVYLDQVLNESFRKYPLGGILMRECTKNYTLPESDIKINVGDHVIIPVYGLHHDPKFYPNPDVFDPERFTEEAKKTRPALSFIAFGDGPRQCIGFRFALAQIKAAIATLVLNFQIKQSDKTQHPIEFEKSNFMLHAKGGLNLEIAPL